MSAFDIEDIEFRRVNGHVLLGRLYRPRLADPVPLLVDVHGGAWTKGDRLANASLHETLANAGIAVFALDFRMPPAAGFLETIGDVNAGIRWAKANAEELGSRPEWLGGLGTSSGGHLLMLNALRPNDLRYATEMANEILLRHVVLGWPILDPLARYRMARERDLASLVKAHDAFWPDEASMERDSPQRIVQDGEYQHLPRVLLIQGMANTNVEPMRADAFGAQYRLAGGDIEVLKYEGEAHSFMTGKPDSGAAMHAADRIGQFVREQGGI